MRPAEVSHRLEPGSLRHVIQMSKLFQSQFDWRCSIWLLLSLMIAVELAADCAPDQNGADPSGVRANELVGRVELPVGHLLELLRSEESARWQAKRSQKAAPPTRTRRAHNFSPSGFRSMLLMNTNTNANANANNINNNLASDTTTDFVARPKRRRKQRPPVLEQPPSELMFSNSTGAVVHCGVAFELAQSVAEADRQQQRPASAPAAIQIRWERANGLEVEPISYAGQTNDWSQPQGSPAPGPASPTLRYVRPADGALVFEPFAAHNFRPDVHATSYRCVASLLDSASGASLKSDQPMIAGSPPEPTGTTGTTTTTSTQAATQNWRHAAAVSRDMRLNGVVSLGSGPNAQQALKITVQDELVSEGNSAHFKCQMPFASSGQLQLVDWLESSPTGASLAVHSASSDLTPRPSRRHFVHPKTGELIVVNVDASLRGRGYKCRCRSKLTGELVGSSSEGKLYVSESSQATPPKVSSYQPAVSQRHELLADGPELGGQQTLRSQPQQQQVAVYEEGEAGLLVCHLQASPRVQFSWFKEELANPAGTTPELIPLEPLNVNILQEQQPQLDKEQQFPSVINASSSSSSSSSSAAAAAATSNSKLNRDQGQPPVKYVQMANLLLINQLNRNDSGHYVCLGHNSQGSTRLNQRLEVRSRLRVRLSASSNVLELGKSLVLECSIEGAPIHQVVFRHNLAVIKSISGSDRVQLERRRQQQQQQSKKSRNNNDNEDDNEDEGDEHESGGGRNSAGLNYFVLEGDENEEEENGASQTEANESQRNNLRGGQPARKSSQIGKQSRAGSSELLSHVMAIVLEPQHAGAYQCFAHNQFESSQATVYIRVLDEPPHFKETFKSELYQVGQDISLRCIARANPLPEITWTIDEQPIALVEQQNSNSNAGSGGGGGEGGGGDRSQRIRFGDYVSRDNLVISYVNISQVQVLDAGLYKCSADTRLARISYQAQINVEGEVQVKPMPNLTVLAGATFRQRCPAVGWPLGEIQWHHAGHRLPFNHRQRVHENGTLEVEHVERSAGDEGEYTCVVFAGSRGNSQQPANESLRLDSGAAAAAGASLGRAPLGHAPGAQASLFVSIRAKPTIEPFQAGRQLREGQRASIMCTISSGDLPISISWFRNDQLLLPLAEAVQQAEQQGGPIDWLQQQQQQHPASGMTAGATSTPSSLAGASQSVALVPLRGLAPASHQATGLEWPQQSDHNNHSILAGVQISRVSDYSSTLLFESLLAHHTGNYTCLARNDVGQSSHQAPMIVQVAPKWSIEPADKNVVRGSSSSIDCMASGFPAPRVIWTKASGDSQTSGSSSQQQFEQHRPPAGSSSGSHHLGIWRSIVSSPHLQVFENGSLNILDARDLDDGHYMCQASNGVGPGLSKVIKITINVAAQFQARHSVQYVTRGEQTQLKCQAKGDWPLAIFWFKNRHKLEPMNLRDSSQSQSRTSSPVAATTSGNSASKQEQQTLLLASTSANVLSVLASSSDNQAVGSNASLDQFESAASQRNAALQNNAVGLVLERYSLQNADYLLAQQHAMGTMSTASILNELKLDSQAARLGSFGEQLGVRSPQQPVVVQTNSALTIQRAERQDTGTFKCLAANNFGRDERIIQLIVQEAPDKIEELSIMEVSSQSVSLGWLAPFDGNAPILSYHIQYRALERAHSDLSMAKLAGQRQQRPTAQRNAPDQLDESGWLNYSVVSASSSADSMRMSASGSVMGKTMLPGGLQQDHSTAQVNKVTLSSLRPVTRYWFRLEAENKLGRGPPSSIIETVTLEEAPGAAPGKVEGVARSSSTIRVSWNKLNERDVFGSVQGYYVGYRPLQPPDGLSAQPPTGGSQLTVDADRPKSSGQTSTSGASESLGPSATNIYKTIQHDDKLNRFETTLTGLKKSTKYLISVQAFNERGTGPASEPIAVLTRDLDPPRQVKLFMRQATNCSLRLEWRPLSQAALASMGSIDRAGVQQASGQLEGQTQGDVVEFYSLFMAEQTGQTLEQPQRWLETRLPANVWFHSVDKLKCGTRYQFQMSATNKIDTGDKSETLDTKTAGGLPIAPDRQSTFDVLNTTCYVVRLDHWQDNGCPIRSMNVRYRLERSRDWTQLAHYQFDLDSADQQEPVGEAPIRRLFARSPPDENFVAGRAADVAGEFLAGDYQMNPVSADELEDDMAAASSLNALDYSDLQAASLIAKDDNNGEGLYSMLKGSELDGREMGQPRDSPVDSMGPGEPASSSHKNSPRLTSSQHQQRAQEWQAFNFVLDKSSSAQTAGDPDGRQLTRNQLEPSTTRADDDWRRGVHLCNLLENNFYVVQIRVENRVGETEAELRLLTSSEGLEYDQDIKRHVVGRLAGLNEPNGDENSRRASSGDSKLAVLAFGQWPMLMPITLTLSTLTVLIIVIMLLKKSSPNEGCRGTGGGGGTSPDSSTGSRTTSTSATATIARAHNNNGNNSNSNQLIQNCHSAAGGCFDSLDDSPRVALSSSVSMSQPGSSRSGYRQASATMQHHRYSPAAPTIAETIDGSELALGAAAVDNYATIVSGPIRHATSLFANHNQHHHHQQQQQQQQQHRQMHSECRRGGDSYSKEQLAALLPTADEINLAQNIYMQRQHQHKALYGQLEASQTSRMQSVPSQALADDLSYSAAAATGGSGAAVANHQFAANSDQFGMLAAAASQQMPSQLLGSPTNATSGFSSSCNSHDSSANAASELHHFRTLPHSAMAHQTTEQVAQMERNSRGGVNVYLCQDQQQVERRGASCQQPDATILYGPAQPAGGFDQDQLASAAVAAAEGHKQPAMQVRHFQMNANDGGANFECQQEACRQQAAAAAVAAAALQSEGLAAHLNLECNHQLGGYDPVYSTIRRTFPQAFKYLTLQQDKSHPTSEQPAGTLQLQLHANPSGQLNLELADRVVS